MSARKWPFYTLPVDGWFQMSALPRSFRSKVCRYQEASGKRFQVRRWDKTDPNSPIVVRRIV